MADIFAEDAELSAIILALRLRQRQMPRYADQFSLYFRMPPCHYQFSLIAAMLFAAASDVFILPASQRRHIFHFASLPCHA